MMRPSRSFIRYTPGLSGRCRTFSLRFTGSLAGIFPRIRLISPLASMVSPSNPGSPRPSLVHIRYELLTLGDELLLGLTGNGHLTFIGAQLGRRGVMLQRNVTITDEADAIERQFRESWAAADVIVTTGGL